MLLHIRPRLFLMYDGLAELVDLSIEPFGVYLRGGFDLMTGLPYRSPRHWSACLKNPRCKLYDGIFLEVAKPVSEFSFVARWAFKASEIITHHVRYRLLDQEHDAATDCTALWHATPADMCGWARRWPARVKKPPPAARIEPLMEFVHWPGKAKAKDKVDHQGFIFERRQEFAMPTIERERLLTMPSKISHRMPEIESAIQVRCQS